jgi:glycerophosphoryl diester phosphodiesterase
MNFLNKLENGLLKLIDGFYSIWPQPSPGRAQLSSSKIISHRGEHDNKTIFENTLAAFDGAEAAGIWGIECDLRWTRDLQPVIIHDPDLVRVFGLKVGVSDVTLAELKSACPQVPSLKEVVQRYDGKLHIMLEIKEEAYPDPTLQNQVLADLFSALIPQQDFHLLTLSPNMFRVIDFVPKSTFLPIARLNFVKLSELARHKKYRGVTGHYLFMTKGTIKAHHDVQQKVGTGYVGSKNCLFRELNRGVEWIFSNNAAELQTIVRDLLKSHSSNNSELKNS